MPLNLKLQHRTILPHHLQINMFVVLSLDSFVGLFLGHDEGWNLLSRRFTKEIPGPHRLSTQAAPEGQKNEAAAPVLTLKTNQGRRTRT